MKRVPLVIVAAAAAVALAGPPVARVEPTMFSHAAHAKLVDTSKCDTCHAVDAAGAIAPPASIGHSPCLDAKCHASEFVSAGPSSRAKNPAAYTKATAFCLGCHGSSDGTPPSPAQHHVADTALRSYQLELEYHVELDHYSHTQRTACRTCHVVDAKSLALVSDAPGHAQCATCHNAQKFPDFTMTKCVYCHQQPGRAQYFGSASRKATDVRACGSEGHAALMAAFGSGGPVGCFTHERAEHRVKPDGTPVQCNACHAVVETPSRRTLAAIHTQPVIDNDKDDEHRSCGKAGCHASDIYNDAGKERCLICHGDRGLFQ